MHIKRNKLLIGRERERGRERKGEGEMGRQRESLCCNKQFCILKCLLHEECSATISHGQSLASDCSPSRAGSLSFCPRGKQRQKEVGCWDKSIREQGRDGLMLPTFDILDK